MIQALAVSVVGAGMLGVGHECWLQDCAMEALVWTLAGMVLVVWSGALAVEERQKGVRR